MKKQKYEVVYPNLLRVANFAKLIGYTPCRLYKMECEKKIEFTMIDGIAFVDKEKYKDIILKYKKTKLVQRIKKIIKVTKHEK